MGCIVEASFVTGGFPSALGSLTLSFVECPQPRQGPRTSMRFSYVSLEMCFQTCCDNIVPTRIEPKHFFLKLFGRFRDIPAKSRDIPPKKFDSLGFEGHTELFGPHPFTWKTPTPPENIRTQKFRFGFFFRAQIISFLVYQR